MGTIFSHVLDLAIEHEMLLLIEFFFYWVGSDLICFCFGFLGSRLFSQF